MPIEWTYADLDPEQLDIVAEAERLLGGDIVMVYRPTTWGTIDPEVGASGLRPDDLDAATIARLQHLEQRVGGVMVAYRLESPASA